MGIEWFRDLSITVLGFVSSAVLIFLAVMAYRLHFVAKETMLSVKEASDSISVIANQFQGLIKPLLPILTLIQGIRQGIKGVSKLFNG